MKKKATKASGEEPIGSARAFLGQDAPGRTVHIRVSIARGPLANLLGHASEFPDVEVCGVLIGEILQDERGPWLDVSAIIRGEGARERGSAVTFTNETWNHIHSELEERHPGKMIVGWYHTHPNFGVFLSEMDTFIHTNFFGHPHHVALVRDPVQGLTAVFYRQGESMVPLELYWVDGLPVTLNTPVESGGRAGTDAILEEIRGLRYAISMLQSGQEESKQKTWLNWAMVVLLAILVSVLTAQFVLSWMNSRRAEEYLERLTTGKILMLPGGTPQAPADTHGGKK